MPSNKNNLHRFLSSVKQCCAKVLSHRSCTCFVPLWTLVAFHSCSVQSLYLIIFTGWFWLLTLWTLTHELFKQWLLARGWTRIVLTHTRSRFKWCSGRGSTPGSCPVVRLSPDPLQRKLVSASCIFSLILLVTKHSLWASDDDDGHERNGS